MCGRNLYSFFLFFFALIETWIRKYSPSVKKFLIIQPDIQLRESLRMFLCIFPFCEY